MMGADNPRGNIGKRDAPDTIEPVEHLPEVTQEKE